MFLAFECVVYTFLSGLLYCPIMFMAILYFQLKLGLRWFGEGL